MNHGPNITCPKCGAEIPLTEAVSQRLREEISNEFEKQRQEQNAAMAEPEKKFAREQTKLEEGRHALQQEVSRQVDAEKQRLLADAKRRAEEKVQVELRDLRAQLGEQQTKLTQAQAAELALRARQRKLEEARDAMELEMARRLDGERAKIAETARLQGAEAERLKLADKEHVIKGLQEQIEALKRRAERGSMQLQGETLEIELENDLRRAFPFDEITEVKKGQRGADVMQRVRTNAGLDCGAILWEAKRARNWTADWPAKLKEDQREAKSELAVLVVTSLPAGVRGMAQIDGIWVCEPALAPIVAAALRQGLVATSDAVTGRTSELPDLRTPADNEAAADFLLDQVRSIVENPDTTLIASLAGGRKTMGALLYACLTLVGRESDRLTHVLVNEPFETMREFWFPTQPGGALTDREGRAHDPACSRVELASVPFVPLRNLFQRDLTRKPGSFRSLIARCSQKVEALARSEMHLELAVDRPEMRVNGVTVKLSVAEYTVIYYLVNAIKKGEPPIGSYDCAANPMTLAAQDLYGQRDPNDFGDWRYKAKPENRGFDAIDDRWITKNVSNLREKLRANAHTAALARLLPTRHRFSLDLPANRVGLLSGS